MARVSMDNDNLDSSVGYKKNSRSDDSLVRRQAEANEKIKEQVRKKYGEKALKENDELQKKINKRTLQLTKNNLNDIWAEKKKQYEEEAKYSLELSKRISSTLKAGAMNVTEKVFGAVSNNLEDYFGSFSKYLGTIDARLQGSTKSFSNISSMISRNLAGSPYVRQTQVLENLNTLVAQGIAYNVEQRAFLMTVSDKIATTFDTFDANLTRLIKIQQADITAARLGMEANLTKFFNKMYQDTSYLNNLSDSVSAAIIEANSQLSRDEALAFEHTVQKWLGSLSSVGMSESTISMLAQGIGYLGSGNISALSSNQELTNLLVMAANQAGLDYSQILTGGANANIINQLMQGVVSFGQQIASSNNQVVKSQYAQLFGMTISDLTSLLNLSSNDLVAISDNMLTYSSAIKETEKQLGMLGSRTTVYDRIQNVFSNFLAGTGENIANNTFAMTTYLLTDMIEETFGKGAFAIDIPIPFAGVTSIDPVNIAKTGVVGLSILGEVGSIIGSLFRGGGLNLSSWGAQDTTGRGRGLVSTLSGTNIATTTSMSAFVGNASESEMYSSSVTAAEQKRAEVVSGEEENELLIVVRDNIASDVVEIRRTLTEIYSEIQSQSNKISSISNSVWGA